MRAIDASHKLYTKQIGNIRYETVLDTRHGVPKSTTIYQKGAPIVNEEIQTQSIKGFNLPKRIVIIQRPVNVDLKNNVEIKSIIEYNTKSFKIYTLPPYPYIPPLKNKDTGR